MKLLLLAFGKPLFAAAGLTLGTYSAKVQHFEADAEFGAAIGGAAIGEVELGELKLEAVLPADVEAVEVVPAVRIQPALPREEEPKEEKQP